MKISNGLLQKIKLIVGVILIIYSIYGYIDTIYLNPPAIGFEEVFAIFVLLLLLIPLLIGIELIQQSKYDVRFLKGLVT